MNFLALYYSCIFFCYQYVIFFMIKRFMDKDGRAELLPIFLEASILKISYIFRPHFNNVKPALVGELLYGISPLCLLLFNILLHIGPLSYILSSISSPSCFYFRKHFLFFYEYLCSPFTVYSLIPLLLCPSTIYCPFHFSEYPT